MSTQTPPIPAHRTHRHTRSAALPTPAAASQNPQNPHYLNLQSHGSNAQIGMSQSSQPTTPPRTPQKSEAGTFAQHALQFLESDSISKPLSKVKNRPKNASVSPAPPKTDRNTPPLMSIQNGGKQTAIPSIRPISTPSAAAYAGPTFHASPAPSALPIPSFYSKSVPDSPGIKGFQTQKDDLSSSGIDSPTPPPAKLVSTQPRREESPLDLFFRADREEKARARSASSFHEIPKESGPFPPPSDSPQNRYDDLSAGNKSGTRGTRFSGGPTSALFAIELDGSNSPGKPYGPAFSAPYNERINAARSSATSLHLTSQKVQGQQQSTDRSEALKAYLFSTQARSATVARSVGFSSSGGLPQDQSASNSASHNASSDYNSQRPPPRSHHGSLSHMKDSASSRHSPRGGSRSSGLRQEVTPTTTPFRVPGQAFVPYPTPPSPSRPPRQEPETSFIGSQGSKSNTASSNPCISSPQSAMPSENRSSDFREMEDSLKRILKLEPPKDVEFKPSGISIAPEMAAPSVPNHVGGRSLPMNGMHNGIVGS